MANVFLDPNLWTDGDNTPPIWWNDTDGQYEILAESSDPGVADGQFSISSTEELQPGDYIEFSYTLNFYAPSGTPTPNVLVITRDNFTLIEVIDVVNNPTGTVRVDIVEAGFYQIQMAVSASLYYELAGFYSFDAVLALPPAPTERSFVYELDRGWTFDGNYIPHYLVLNWYFGDNPVDYTSIQKVRIHGLSKGRAFLQMSVNGIQQDGYEEEFTEPQWIDLPRNPKLVSTELVPETNYTDTANRGLAIQMKFEGRNTDIALPEPGHVVQVLVVQASPPGTGFRSN